MKNIKILPMLIITVIIVLIFSSIIINKNNKIKNKFLSKTFFQLKYISELLDKINNPVFDKENENILIYLYIQCEEFDSTFSFTSSIVPRLYYFEFNKITNLSREIQDILNTNIFVEDNLNTLKQYKIEIDKIMFELKDDKSEGENSNLSIDDINKIYKSNQSFFINQSGLIE